MLVGNTFWVCEKCGFLVKQKSIGKNCPRMRLSCKCKEINITHKELVDSKGQIKNSRCLEVGWVKAKVLVVS